MATKRWLGNAVAIQDLWTASLSGIVTSQTYSMTINGKSVTYISTGIDTVATVLAALATNWNASTITEFTEATASAGSTTLTITGDKAGNPLSITVSTTGGASFSIANTTSATGPNDFGNGQNWTGGSAPANSDTLVFDTGSVDCAFGLTTSLSGITLIVNPGYSGNIGLYYLNKNSQTSYYEYRPQYLTLAGGTVTINAPSVQRCNLAFGANQAIVQVMATGSRIDKYTAPVLIVGGNSSSQLDITKGDVAIANYQGDSATFPTVQTSYTGNAPTDVNLYCGPGAVLTTITKNGGNLTINSNVANLTQGVAGGTVTIAAGGVATLIAENGTVNYSSVGVLGTATIAGQAVLTFDGDPRAKSVTSPIQVYGDRASVSDNAKTVNSGTLSVTTNQTTSINVSHGSGNVLQLT